MSDEKYRLPSKKSSIIIAALIITAIISAAMFGMYPAVTNRIIGVSMQNMQELAAHNEHSIEAGIEEKWDILRGIALNIRQMKCEKTSDLLAALSANERILDCERIILIDEDGGTVSSNFVMSEGGEINDIPIYSGDEQYICISETESAAAEGHRHVLTVGTRITPFVVENKRYTNIRAIMEISVLSAEMSADIYGGTGSSSIVDKDGRYVIHNNKSYTLGGTDDPFADLEDSTKEYVRERMSDRETFLLRLKNKAGKMLVLSFVPMAGADWYFVMTVPLSVFEEQSASLINLFFLLTVLLFAAGAAIVFVVLQRRVRLLTLEQKHHKEMSDALVLAEQANRAKTVFLSNMSHDIRTPMNAIIGFTALAKEHIDDKEKVDIYLEKITRSSNHLLALINDVLDMSRIESGRLSLVEKPEDLFDILSTLKSIVQIDADLKQLDFEVDVSGITNEHVYCDRLRLNQLLLNLVSNAIKFTQRGGKVTMTVTQTGQPTSESIRCVFIVKDNGIGMSAEFIEKLFEPFSREKNSTMSGIQGTGLGMSITKNIIDMMGGEIDVKSEENKGTEFTVTLDFRLCEDFAAQSAGDEEPQADGAEFSLSGRRVLLTEDNELNREIATELLSDSGLLVECAENGAVAVEMLTAAGKGYYDAVLMDIQMPVMDGYEAARTIRGLDSKELSGIPIIAMTANAFEDDKRAAFEAGMNAHVGKPFDLSVLLDTLKEVMRKTR